MSNLLAVSLSIIGISLFLVIVFIVLFNFFRRQINQEIKTNQEQFLNTVKQQFSLDQAKGVTELETRKQAVESTVKNLQEQLDKYQVLLRQVEEDRARKYGNLENELKNASQATSKLQETTNKLNDILGNVKLRGQWGERMAEDIIRNAGLIEGVNYNKQKQLASSTSKPDFTFILPNDHIVNMDVKFPLDNYLNWVNSQSPADKERFQKEFFRNVKDRIKEIQNREYINPQEKTLDFVLLFIPNEQVFGMIQEEVPNLMDDSLKQKVVLCSPFTLYAMLSVIRQAYENFRFERDLKEIINHITLFSRHYDKFKIRFEEIGKAIENIEKRYNDVKTTDFKKLDTKIRHIEEYKKENNIAISDEPEAIDVTQETF